LAVFVFDVLAYLFDAAFLCDSNFPSLIEGDVSECHTYIVLDLSY